MQLSHLPTDAARAFNRAAVARFAESCRVPPAALVGAIIRRNRLRQSLAKIDAMCAEHPPRLSGSDALELGHAYGSAAETDIESDLAARSNARAPIGVRVLIIGGLHVPAFYRALEDRGFQIVGEQVEFGVPSAPRHVSEREHPIDALAAALRPPAPMPSVQAWKEAVQSRAAALGVQAVIFALPAYNHPTAWIVPILQEALAAQTVRTLVAPTDCFRDPHSAAASIALGLERAMSSISAGQEPEGGASGFANTRARHVSFARENSAFNKDWFAALKGRVTAGEKLAFVNADVPTELFKAMDIPVVVNQWWSAVISAKQKSPVYFGALNEAGYRGNLCKYCSLALASELAGDDDPPWGGLPRPAVLVSGNDCGAQHAIFGLWSERFDIPLFRLDRAESLRRPQPGWLDRLRTGSEEIFGPETIGFLAAQYAEMISFLETHTAKRFDPEKLSAILSLVNEQEDEYRRTRGPDQRGTSGAVEHRRPDAGHDDSAMASRYRVGKKPRRTVPRRDRTTHCRW